MRTHGTNLRRRLQNISKSEQVSRESNVTKIEKEYIILDWHKNFADDMWKEYYQRWCDDFMTENLKYRTSKFKAKDLSKNSGWWLK